MRTEGQATEEGEAHEGDVDVEERRFALFRLIKVEVGRGVGRVTEVDLGLVEFEQGRCVRVVVTVLVSCVVVRVCGCRDVRVGGLRRGRRRCRLQVVEDERLRLGKPLLLVLLLVVVLMTMRERPQVAAARFEAPGELDGVAEGREGDASSRARDEQDSGGGGAHLVARGRGRGVAQQTCECRLSLA